MLTGIPKSEDFTKLATECLNQAFDMAYDVDAPLRELEDEELSPEEVWKHNQGIFRTSIVLIHQAIESFMKAVVCQVSPFLLLETRRTDWPILPDSADKDFGELFTIGAESLLYTFCAVSPQSISKQMVSFINAVRKKRNEITHGIPSNLITPRDTVSMVLRAYTYFLGKDAWWKTLRQQFIKDPLFGSFDTDFEIASFGRRFDYAESILGTGTLRHHFTQDLKARRYYCPSCKPAYEQCGEDLDSKWAFLAPNKPESTTILCIACQSSFLVERADCLLEDCPGNVIYLGNEDVGTCLTCGEPQIPEE